MKTPAQVYQHYKALGDAFNDRYRKRLAAADPRVGLDLAFHLAGNWGNDAARALLRRYQDIQGWRYYRERREYAAALHYHEHSPAFTPNWCAACHPDSIDTDEARFAPSPHRKDPETELRALWTAKGVPQPKQDAILAEIAAKAQPGAAVGPFIIGGQQHA